MIKRFAQITLLALSLILFGSSMALAFSCPLNIVAFDQAVAAGPSVSADVLKQATDLRNKAENQHNAGDHGGSIESINKALDLIGAE